MQGKMKWLAVSAVAGGLLIGSVVVASVSAQTATQPGQGMSPGHGMMGGGFGPGGHGAAFGPGAPHEAIADALGITSQELWDARATGKSVADVAAEKNVDLTAVADAALATHTARMAGAVEAGALSQAQADAMKALMQGHIETQFQATNAIGPMSIGMMDGRGMMGPGFAPGLGHGPGFGPGGRVTP